VVCGGEVVTTGAVVGVVLVDGGAVVVDAGAGVAACVCAVVEFDDGTGVLVSFFDAAAACAVCKAWALA